MTTTYIQIDLDTIQTSETHIDGSFTSGIVRKNETRSRTVQDGTEQVLVGHTEPTYDEEGNELTPSTPIYETQPKYIEQPYLPWDELVAADLAGDISVTWLDEVVYQAEQDAMAAQQATDAATKATKMLGIAYNGVNVSLTESNQNGLAAVMSGQNLAVEFGGSIFPLNFSAETATGFETITFATLVDFKAFALTFMSARQQFFQ